MGKAVKLGGKVGSMAGRAIGSTIGRKIAGKTGAKVGGQIGAIGGRAAGKFAVRKGSKLLGSFKKGGHVKRTGPYKLHRGEFVVNAKRVAALKRRRR